VGIAGVDVDRLAGHKARSPLGLVERAGVARLHRLLAAVVGFLERIEQRIGWLCARAQCYVWATRGPTGPAIPSRPASRRPS
jgi:hypothetical protein